MCGIVAYVGHQSVSSILLKGLKRLEYRGYDSVGIAMIHGKLEVVKTKGKVQSLQNLIVSKNSTAKIGIGHTRWATHGEPSNDNAHPHVSASGKISMVHNGIIENYSSLKQELLAKGHHFTSETDSEVLIHFIEDIKEKENQKEKL